MHLIQILLPLYDNDATPLHRLHQEVKKELTAQFGGLTAYSRGPAEGLWMQDGASVKDDIVVYEVMTDGLDAAWWKEYRHGLEARFAQIEVVIRAMGIVKF